MVEAWNPRQIKSGETVAIRMAMLATCPPPPSCLVALRRIRAKDAMYEIAILPIHGICVYSLPPNKRYMHPVDMYKYRIHCFDFHASRVAVLLGTRLATS